MGILLMILGMGFLLLAVIGLVDPKIGLFWAKFIAEKTELISTEQNILTYIKNELVEIKKSINRICSFVLLSETNPFYNNVTQERKNIHRRASRTGRLCYLEKPAGERLYQPRGQNP